MKNINEDLIKEFLTYNKFTGKFYWTKDSKFYKKNEVAGYLRPDGYEVITINGIKYLSHRLAFVYVNGDIGNSIIDHINGLRSDNRIDNLRISDKKSNARNCGIYQSNKSGFKGVTFIKSTGKWRASASFNGKSKHIGNYETKEFARDAYISFINENYGEFIHHSLSAKD